MAAVLAGKPTLAAIVGGAAAGTAAGLAVYTATYSKAKPAAGAKAAGGK